MRLIGIRTGFSGGDVTVVELSTSRGTDSDVIVESLSAAGAGSVLVVTCWKSIESLPSTGVTSTPNVHCGSGLMSTA